MAVASFVPRRMETTSRLNACENTRLTALPSPRPRDLRDCPRARQSSCSSVNMRMPASPPYTKRDGRCRIWTRPSARSVGSSPNARTTLGTAIAATRRNVANAKYSEPSEITMMPPRFASTTPDVLPYSATETKLPVAAIHTGHVLRSTVHGATPPIHSSAISSANATDADTTSSVRNMGTHSIRAPMKRLTGLILAINHDGDAGRASSGRSLWGTR